MAESNYSFSKKIKEELVSNAYSDDEKKCILSGFIRNCGVFSFNRNEMVLSTKNENSLIIKLIYACLKDVYQLNPEIKYSTLNAFGRGLVYVLEVKDKNLDVILQELEILDENYERIPPKEFIKKDKLKPFLIGCFLANGSVNNPYSNKITYFAEMAFSNKKDAMVIKKKLNSFQNARKMEFKYILRRDKHVLYLKKSDQISVFISFLGAVSSMFDYENARLERDSINTMNRLNICDAANLKKSIDTGKKDLEAIDTVLKIKKLNNLDEKTKIVIQARRANPEMNYRELAEYIVEHDKISITKSGVVHILTKIKDMAKDINENIFNNA